MVVHFVPEHHHGSLKVSGMAWICLVGGIEVQAMCFLNILDRLAWAPPRVDMSWWFSLFCFSSSSYPFKLCKSANLCVDPEPQGSSLWSNNLKRSGIVIGVSPASAPPDVDDSPPIADDWTYFLKQRVITLYWSWDISRMSFAIITLLWSAIPNT